MPKLDPSFSESTFAFAFTENLINGGLLNSSTAPRFLSTYEEGKGSHWDIHLPTNPVAFFFQFKIPHVLLRGRKLSNNRMLQLPFYRMNLRHQKEYAQHKGLLSLESQGRNVYYTCSRFHEANELDNYFVNKQVPQNSVWFRPSQVTPPDYEGGHGIVYDESGTDWEIRSPKPKASDDPCDYKRFLEKWNAAVESASKQNATDFIDSLSNSISEAIAAGKEKAKYHQAVLPESESAIGLETTREGKRQNDDTKKAEVHPVIELLSSARSSLGIEILIGGRDKKSAL